MKRTTTTASLLLGALMFFACHNEPKPTTDTPSLFQEKPSAATNVSEQIPVPSGSQGNFENLIADYENKDRGIWQKPNMVISLLGDLENNLPVGPPDEFKVALNQVEKELLTAGFNIEKIDKDALDYQYIVIASTPETQAPAAKK